MQLSTVTVLRHVDFLIYKNHFGLLIRLPIYVIIQQQSTVLWEGTQVFTFLTISRKSNLIAEHLHPRFAKEAQQNPLPTVLLPSLLPS